jgi:PhoH-like ATPase
MESDVMRKIIVIDQSILLNDSTAELNFQDNMVIFPWSELEELECQAANSDNVSSTAAKLALEALRSLQNGRDLSKGVPTPRGGFFLVEKDYYLPKDIKIDIHNNGNSVIGAALKWKHRNEIRADKKGAHDPFEKFGPLGEVIVVTKNPALHLKASACGLITQDYLSNRVIQKPEELYSGLACTEVSDDAFRSLGDLFYSGGIATSVPMEKIADMVDLPKLFPNQCCIFASEGEARELLALYKYNDGHPCFRSVPKPHPSNGRIHPRNNRQALSHALLMDPEITLVALSGIAGGGKSLMALLAGRDQTMGKPGGKSYSQMCICRPNWEMGKALGYLKGDLTEKWAPWAAPILDLFELLEVKKDLDKMIDGTDPEIQIMPINFIQGRSLNKRFLMLDEAQNFNREEAKAFICRAGEGTKVVLTGDVTQIVNPNLDLFSCGLSHVIQRMQGEEYFGCLHLERSERSSLAQHAADRL